MPYGCDGMHIGDTGGGDSDSDVDDTCSLGRLVGVSGGVESFNKSTLCILDKVGIDNFVAAKRKKRPF